MVLIILSLAGVIPPVILPECLKCQGPTIDRNGLALFHWVLSSILCTRLQPEVSDVPEAFCLAHQAVVLTKVTLNRLGLPREPN